MKDAKYYLIEEIDRLSDEIKDLTSFIEIEEDFEKVKELKKERYTLTKIYDYLQDLYWKILGGDIDALLEEITEFGGSVYGN